MWVTLILQSIWATLLSYWTLRAVAQHQTVVNIVLAVLACSYGIASLLSFGRLPMARYVAAAQLVVLWVLFITWALLQLAVVMFGTLYLDSPASLFVVALVLAVTLVPSTLLVVVIARFKERLGLRQLLPWPLTIR